MKNNQQVWNNPLTSRFSETLLAFDAKNELQNFLSDVMTEKEIKEISARFEAARLLTQKVSYSEVATQTGLSSRTIARISEWLKNGTGGYRTALKHHEHIPPDRAA